MFALAALVLVASAVALPAARAIVQGIYIADGIIDFGSGTLALDVKGTVIASTDILSEEEERALWDEVFADEAMEIRDFSEVEVASDARVSSG